MHKMGWTCLVMMAVLAGCSFNKTVNENSEASSSGSERLALNSSETVMLEVDSNVGTIQIQPGAADEVLIDYTKTAYGQTDQRAQDELAEMTVLIDQQPDRVVVNTVQRANLRHPRTNKVDLTITVPPQIALNIINQVGDVTIKGLTIPSALTVKNDVGNITLDGVTVQAGMLVICDVGDVRFSGDLGDLGMYTLSADVGSIAVTLPADTSAMLDVAAQVGSISVDNAFTLSGQTGETQDVHATLKGTLGDGVVQVNVRTNVGNVSINPR